MRKDGGLLRGLEAGKAQLVRHLKSTRQNQAQGLAAQLIFSSAIGLLESLVYRNHLPLEISQYKGPISVLQRFNCGLNRSRSALWLGLFGIQGLLDL